MDVGAYLQRIAYTGPREPNVETLRRLHRAHLYAVPFENLDIPLGQPIELSLPSLFDKIVRRRRGGFCYELNGLFAWLLGEMGFTVDRLAGRVFSGERFGPERAHMLLLVDVGQVLIADVGFGDSFLDPVPLDHDPHDEPEPFRRSYRLAELEGEWALHQRSPDSSWRPQYAFSLEPHRLDDFDAMCHFHQTSPESSFTTGSVCSLATPTGRITLSNGHLIVTTGRRREERKVADPDEYIGLLRGRFGIDLGRAPRVDTLLYPGNSSSPADG